MFKDIKKKRNPTSSQYRIMETNLFSCVNNQGLTNVIKTLDIRLQWIVTLKDGQQTMYPPQLSQLPDLSFQVSAAEQGGLSELRWEEVLGIMKELKFARQSPGRGLHRETTSDTFRDTYVWAVKLQTWVKVKVKLLSHVQLFATPWTVA